MSIKSIVSFSWVSSESIKSLGNNLSTTKCCFWCLVFFVRRGNGISLRQRQYVIKRVFFSLKKTKEIPNGKTQTILQSYPELRYAYMQLSWILRSILKCLEKIIVSGPMHKKETFNFLLPIFCFILTSLCSKTQAFRC